MRKLTEIRPSHCKGPVVSMNHAGIALCTHSFCYPPLFRTVSLNDRPGISIKN